MKNRPDQLVSKALRRTLTAGLAAALFTLNASAASTMPTMPTMPETVTTIENNGQSINISVGQLLRVRLPESPTTGYAWAIRGGTEVLTLKASDFAAAASGALGGAGVRTLIFTAHAPGTTTLRLALLRDWETHVPAVEEFSLTVHADLP